MKINSHLCLIVIYQISTQKNVNSDVMIAVASKSLVHVGFFAIGWERFFFFYIFLNR